MARMVIDCLNILNMFIFILCVKVLSVCMDVYYVHAWELRVP